MEPEAGHDQNDIVAEVKNGLSILVGTIKKFAFYPETNNILQQSLQQIQEWFDVFLEAHGSLRLTVEKDRLLFQGDVVHQDKPSEQTVVMPLFRDGVQWIEFLDGLTSDEVKTFITLLNRFRILKEESEDDLVTAMWEAEFLFIKYKTADEFWEIEPLVDLSSLRVTDDSEPEEVEAEDEGDGEAVGFELKALARDYDENRRVKKTGGSAKSVSSLFTHFDLTATGGAGVDAGAGRQGGAKAQDGFAAEMALSVEKVANYFGGEKGANRWKFTSDEEKQLRDLIADEKRRNSTQDSLEILLIIISQLDERPDSVSVLDFLVDEVHYALSQASFYFVHNFLDSLIALPDSAKPWLTALVAELLRKLSGPEVLDALKEVWPYAYTLTDDSFDELNRLLRLLPPESINALAPMISRTGNPKVEKLLLEIVTTQICQIRTSVVPLIASLRPAAICELIPAFKAQDLVAPPALLIGLTRNESPLVREAAARALLEQNPDNAREVFHLVDDPHWSIKRLVCSQLGRERNAVTEKLLFEYLSDSYNQKIRHKEDHLLLCYQTFGQCASAKAIPFLQNILLKKDWKSYLGIEGHYHREGAALALMLLPEEWGTAEILQKAVESPFRNIRQAYIQAGEEVRKKRLKANG